VPALEAKISDLRKRLSASTEQAKTLADDVKHLESIAIPQSVARDSKRYFDLALSKLHKVCNQNSEVICMALDELQSLETLMGDTARDFAFKHAHLVRMCGQFGKRLAEMNALVRVAKLVPGTNTRLPAFAVPSTELSDVGKAIIGFSKVVENQPVLETADDAPADADE
jgi:hypothetical protein